MFVSPGAMVCVPCFVIPALLFLFRMVIQPLVYRIWGRRMQEPALSCPMPQKKKIKSDSEGSSSTAKELETNAGDGSKKLD